jgi:hypothetical protein
MAARIKYQKKPSQYVTAVQLNLDTDGLTYRKWGGEQHAKRGDWLVDNDGEIYTVDGKVFRRTYRRLRPGAYLKKSPVWAEVAKTAGKIKTKEGYSSYRKGDYIVHNQRNGTDGYCMRADKFKSMYQRAK